MTVDIATMLKAIGPGASIIFAAWIFMAFVQTRYDSAVDRYRAVVGQYRSADMSDARRGNLRDQIKSYKRRCELMHYANTTGLVSAMFLLLTLITASVGMIFKTVQSLMYVSTISMLAGFLLVVVAAGCIFLESSIVRRQLNEELMDVHELAEITGQETGDITKK